jgi:cytoskeletal protein CcmA (bactofilin family)
MRNKTKDITIFSEKSDIEGKLKMPGKVMILGSFTGSINSSSLEIFKNGKALGTIEAENVIIAGYFEGELACSGLLTIAKTAKVKGKVAYGTLSVEPGGMIEAELFQSESMDTKLIPFYDPKRQSKKK